MTLDANTGALKGARFGVLTQYFGTEADDQEAGRIVRAAIDKLRARGAEVVNVTVPSLDSLANGAGVFGQAVAAGQKGDVVRPAERAAACSQRGCQC